VHDKNHAESYCEWYVFNFPHTSVIRGGNDSERKAHEIKEKNDYQDPEEGMFHFN